MLIKNEFKNKKGCQKNLQSNQLFLLLCCKSAVRRQLVGEEIFFFDRGVI